MYKNYIMVKTDEGIKYYGYIFVYDRNNKKVYCYIFAKEADGTDFIMTAGYAYCSKEDNYSKKFGRSLSFYRAMIMLPSFENDALIVLKEHFLRNTKELESCEDFFNPQNFSELVEYEYDLINSDGDDYSVIENVKKECLRLRNEKHDKVLQNAPRNIYNLLFNNETKE